MLFQQKPKVATAGTNFVTIKLPVRTVLKKVNALNETKAWQKTSIGLFEGDDSGGRNLSLLHKVSQPGDRDLSWEGSMLLEVPFTVVGVTFYGADAADALTVTIGYERAPTKRKGWGE